MVAQAKGPLGAVLVTGATGLVGRALVNALVDTGHPVTALTRTPELAGQLWPTGAVRMLQADLATAASLRAALDGIDTLFHLACYMPQMHEASPLNARGHWEVTAVGTANLLAQVSGSRLKRLLYITSVRALGRCAGTSGQPATERTPPAPCNLYSQATLTAERHLLELGPAAGVKTSVLRLPMLYGFDRAGEIASLVEAVAARRFPAWPRVDNQRSAIHIEDAVAAALLIAFSPRSASQIYHATDGEPYSTRWIYEQTLTALGWQLPRWRVPLWVLRAGALSAAAGARLLRTRAEFSLAELGTLSRDAWFSSEKLRTTLGFVPRHRLGDEIRRLTQLRQHPVAATTTPARG